MLFFGPLRKLVALVASWSTSHAERIGYGKYPANARANHNAGRLHSSTPGQVSSSSKLPLQPKHLSPQSCIHHHYHLINHSSVLCIIKGYLCKLDRYIKYFYIQSCNHDGHFRVPQEDVGTCYRLAARESLHLTCTTSSFAHLVVVAHTDIHLNRLCLAAHLSTRKLGMSETVPSGLFTPVTSSEYKHNRAQLTHG